MRIAYLGPAGTFTEDALGEALGDAEFEALRTDTVFDAIQAVIEGRADRALAPYENSIEGSVRGTLDHRLDRVEDRVGAQRLELGAAERFTQGVFGEGPRRSQIGDTHRHSNYSKLTE